MKSKTYIIISILFCFFSFTITIADELIIDANQVQLNKENKIVFAEGNV